MGRVLSSGNYHLREAIRIKRELDGLGPEFAEDGIIKTILRERIAMEGMGKFSK